MQTFSTSLYTAHYISYLSDPRSPDPIMASDFIITPWKDLDEVLNVRDLLYPTQMRKEEDPSEKVNRRQLGVNIVSILLQYV
jgi:hypothetical protein